MFTMTYARFFLYKEETGSSYLSEVCSMGCGVIRLRPRVRVRTKSGIDFNSRAKNIFRGALSQY